MWLMTLIIKVETEAQAAALHQLSDIGIYDFWKQVSSSNLW